MRSSPNSNVESETGQLFSGEGNLQVAATGYAAWATHNVEVGYQFIASNSRQGSCVTQNARKCFQISKLPQNRNWWRYSC